MRSPTNVRRVMPVMNASSIRGVTPMRSLTLAAAWTVVALTTAGTAHAQALSSEVRGAVAGEDFGHAVSACGDVDRDGTPDLLVGSPRFDGTTNNVGRARVISGEWLSSSARGQVPQTAEVLYEWIGDPAMRTGFGASVSGGGDVDGDGVPDLVVGAPGDDNGALEAGSVRVFSGASGAALATVYGSILELSGTSVVLADDVDGDGYDDVAIGAPGSVTDTSWFPGYVRVISGNWIRLGGIGPAAVLYEIAGDAGADRLGDALARLSDIDGDGVDELAACAPLGRSDHRGYVRIVSGRTGAALVTLAGARRNDFFGRRAADVGDVNRDGFRDLAVGSDSWDPVANVQTQHGRAIVCSGEWIARTAAGQVPATALELFAFVGREPGERLGWSVAGPGDVNGDGWLDVAAGTRTDGGPGHARVFSGQNGDELRDYVDAAPGTYFGSALAALGDLDGNGSGDLAVGGPGVGGPGGVRAFFHHGARFCLSTPNSSGREARLYGAGSPSAAANDLVLHAAGVPAGSIGTFFCGRLSQSASALFDGYLCVSASRLYRLRTVAASATGELVLRPDLTRPPDPADPMAPGTTWLFQALYRDPAWGAGTNLTDGLQLSFTP